MLELRAREIDEKVIERLVFARSGKALGLLSGQQVDVIRKTVSEGADLVEFHSPSLCPAA